MKIEAWRLAREHESIPRSPLQSNLPDYLLLLAWNFVDELLRNTTDYRAGGGRYVVPIPSLRVL